MGRLGILSKIGDKLHAAEICLSVHRNGAFITAFVVLVSLGFSVETNIRGIGFALIAGLLGSLGGLSFVHSVSRGKASVVITMTALYPVVTVILSFLILRETITLRQGVGIVFALIAMLLLSK